MSSKHPGVDSLVGVLRRHFERDATRNEVRASVRDVCSEMHEAGVPPQTMLVALKAAVQTAAQEARAPVARDELRLLMSDLTPWMIEVCFDPQPSGPPRSRMS